MHVCMHMCVCMYVCMYEWMYGCMYVWMYGCMYVCMDVWMYVWMYGCMYVCMYVCLSVCLSACLSVAGEGKQAKDNLQREKMVFIGTHSVTTDHVRNPDFLVILGWQWSASRGVCPVFSCHRTPFRKVSLVLIKQRNT